MKSAKAAVPIRPAGLVAGQSAADAAAHTVMAVLPGVMDAMRRAMRDQLGGALTVPQFRCLNYVDHHPGSSIGAIASFLGVGMATASAMVDRLVRAGHLQADASAADRRRTELHICPGGKALLERMRSQTRSDLAQSLRGRAPRELDALVLGLQVLADAFPAARPD